MAELGIVRLYNDAWLPMPATEKAAMLDVSVDFWQGHVTQYTPYNQKEDIEVKPYDADDESIFSLQPLHRALLPTGISLLIPHGCYVLVYPRSGLSLKKGVNLINNVGVIDSDYSGELMLPVVNTSSVPVDIYDGERIAQLILMKNEPWSIVTKTKEELMAHVAVSTRVEGLKGGFGSTGWAS